MKVITNHKPRELVSLADLPPKVQQNFDYVREVGDYTPRFIMYRGEWYDVMDSMSVPGAEAPADQREMFKGWHGYESHSFFSGVVFRLVNHDQVIVGRYYA